MTELEKDIELLENLLDSSALMAAPAVLKALITHRLESMKERARIDVIKENEE